MYAHERLLIYFFFQVKGLYKLEVHIHSYDNPSGRCPGCIERLNTEPGCCDLYSDLDSCMGDDKCDTYFIYAVGTLDSSQPGDNCSSSELQSNQSTRQVSLHNEDDRYLDFSNKTVLGLSNPLILHGVDDAWRVC